MFGIVIRKIEFYKDNMYIFHENNQVYTENNNTVTLLSTK